MNHDIYTAPNKERQDADLVAIARGMLSLVHCPGGRITVKGYVCMHCGVDFTSDENKGFCGQPVEEDRFTPFDTTEARRTMQDSLSAHGEMD